MPTLCSLFPMKLVVYFQIMNLKFEVGINQRFGGFIAAIEEVGDYTLQIVCIFFVCEEANKTLNYLRLIANKANKLQRPMKIKIKASIKVPLAL